MEEGLLPFNKVKVLPVPIFLKSNDPTSPLEALYPPLKSVWLKVLLPISASSANNSSPDSTPIPSMSSLVMTVTGRAPVIFAPLICDPTVTTSSTSEAASESIQMLLQMLKKLSLLDRKLREQK